MDEERLAGGHTHAEIVRVGDTVRRPTGHWTPGVHALLRHLEARGYEGAPRVLGLDDQGRETLTYVPGAVVWPEHFALVQTETALAEVAVTIRRYHDAVADFEPPCDSTWAENGSDPRGPAELGATTTSRRGISFTALTERGRSSTGISLRLGGAHGICHGRF